MVRDIRRVLSVPAAKLRRSCDSRVFKFKTTAEIEPLNGTVGQDRAVSAMDFGLSIEAEGFNLFVSGPTGTGRSTELRTQLERIAKTRPAPRDWCYVFNFADPARPDAISLPAGRGHQLGHDVDDAIEALRRDVPRAFESDEYAQRRDAIGREVAGERERLFEALQKEAQSRELAVNVTAMGITTVPMLDGKPLTREGYDALADDTRHAIQERTAELDSIIAQMAPQLRRLERNAAQLLAKLDAQVIAGLAAPLIDELKRDYADEPDVIAYVDRLSADVVENLAAFRGQEEPPQQVPGVPAMPNLDGVFNRYKVNCIITCDADSCAPVVFEDNPTYFRTFGRVDYRASFGAMITDHTMIKPGALHRANGGFLVVQALDVLTQPLVWDTLKRALRTRQARLENPAEQMSIIPTATLSPEPIPLSVKVAMIGAGRTFQILQNADEDFRKLFKARADFTTDVERIDEHVQLYARFVALQVNELGMRPFDRAAVARIVEHSSRMVSNQTKLSLRMMDLTDVLVEADYWACDEGVKVVGGKHVERAIEQRVYRSSLVEDRIHEFIESGTIKVDVRGAVTGQVNGLSVYDLGDYSFGRPSRITARVSLGRGQVVNIEREVQRSGASHSKGFLILQGYINGKFAHRQPLSFAATIAFEQMYDEVDGDSASSTELYALLSAITDVPLRQGIAVTGSVNQLGQIQAIGGVNEKIEGFYAVCKARGLTRDQGVMIPKDNLRNLMLKPEVVEAVRNGNFHIYAVSSIEEGIEILTGIPAGKLRASKVPGNEKYPEGTIFRRVTDALEAMTRRAVEVNRAAQRELADGTSTNAPSANGGKPAAPVPAPSKKPKAPAKRAPARKPKRQGRKRA